MNSRENIGFLNVANPRNNGISASIRGFVVAFNVAFVAYHDVCPSVCLAVH